MLQDGVGQLAPNQARYQVEVIVVREHERPLAAPARFAHDLLGEELVDQAVALGPGSVRAVVEHRRFRQVPQVMLHEPEQRVGDGVVVEVVGQPWRVDPAHLESRAVGRLDHHRFAAVAQLELALEAVAHAGDPDRPGRLGQSGEPGHQPARATHEPLPIGRIGRQLHRRPIGGHDRIEVPQEAPGVLFDRQHGSCLTLRGALEIAAAGSPRLHRWPICDIVNIKIRAKAGGAMSRPRG